MIDWIKENKGIAIAVLVAFFLGYYAGYVVGVANSKTVVKYQTIPATAKTETKTEIQYIPKTVYVDSSGQNVTEKTDVEANVPKTELNIKVNGKAATFSKTEEEKYLFDKNKLQLNQSSTATVELQIPTIDKTKRFGVGAGYGSHGVGYTAQFPIHKNLDGWAYHDKDTIAGGILIRF